MKKRFIGTIAVIALLSVGLTSSIAAGSGSEQGRNFVDADENGVCDLNGAFCRYADADRDGVCDYRGTKQKECRRYFADTDSNNACDNCRGQGLNLGHSFQGGRGR